MARGSFAIMKSWRTDTRTGIHVRRPRGSFNTTRPSRPGVTVGMHICRGNNRSAYMARGGYEPVAERLFGEVEVDRFLLESDTERAGGFEPLRFRPGSAASLPPRGATC